VASTAQAKRSTVDREQPTEVTDDDAPKVSLRRRQWNARLRGASFMAGEFILLILAWHFLVKLLEIPNYLLPSPLAVGETLVADWSNLLMHTRTTVGEILVGYGIAAVLGISLAVLMVTSRPVEKAVYPLLVMLQAIPKVAIAPLLVVWLGYGTLPIIATTMLIAFFPITVATTVGLKDISDNMLNLGRIMGLSWAQMFIKIRAPKSLPSVFGGLKVGMTLAVIGAVVGEFIGAESGLGALILLSTSALSTATTFAAILIIAVVGVALFWIIEGIERVAIPWHETQTREREALL
jgi:NitT/TauT family transport system permease protein